MASKGAKLDLSSFMCITLMLIGCLVTILVSNIMIVSANPDNISVTTVIRAHGFVDGTGKDPPPTCSRTAIAARSPSISTSIAITW